MGIAFWADLRFRPDYIQRHNVFSGMISHFHTPEGLFSCIVYFSLKHDPKQEVVVCAFIVVSEHLPAQYYSAGAEFCIGRGLPGIIADGVVVSSSFPFKPGDDGQAMAERTVDLRHE